MRRSTWFGLMPLPLLLLLAIAAPAGPSADPEAAADLRALLDRQVADWNRGDLDGFLKGYWANPGVVFQSGGDRVDGWEAMRARYQRTYREGGRAMGQLAFKELEVVPIGTDHALVRGAWGLTMPDGRKPGGRFTLIARKLPEGWRIVHDHTSAAATPAP